MRRRPSASEGEVPCPRILGNVGGMQENAGQARRRRWRRHEGCQQVYLHQEEQ